MVTIEFIERFEANCNRYISELEHMEPTKAKEVTRQNLIRMGVLDQDGKQKEQIVTGDFFGW